MKRDLRLQRTYSHAPARVWRALTDRHALAQWLMENDFEPKLGHRFTFRSKPVPGWDGITHCEVTELEPGRCVAFTWRGGAGPDKPLTLDTIVRFTIEPDGDGTRLTLEHRGFTGLRAVLVSFMMGSGWAKMLRTRLPAELDRSAVAA
jgi:uncharacterized protein YndB with AHSA1/START domain